MVRAKLDQSRVLVTKFHQNRSTLKGISAVKDRHTHRQTNSAENKGPFGGSCPVTEFCQVQNSLCVQVLRSPILAALLHGT